MRFSIIIPAHNEEEVIEKCLRALLNQTKTAYEIIVVDDGSTDNTSKIVKEFERKSKKIKINSLKGGEGGSAAASRNKGSEKASGDFLIFVDADQIAEKKFLEKIQKFLKKEDVDATDYLVYSYHPKTIFQKGWSAYRKVNPSINMPHIIKRLIFNKLKYNEKIFYYEDGEIKERFFKRGYIYKGPTDAILYHIETKNFKDFKRQRKWQGLGIYQFVNEKRNFISLKYFFPVFLLLLLPFTYIPFLLYILLFWIILSIKSKDIINSLIWVLIDYLGRIISLYYFIKTLFFGFKR
jgi:glycosyltransferase involved in cell wall biosynthesis